MAISSDANKRVEPIGAFQAGLKKKRKAEPEKLLLCAGNLWEAARAAPSQLTDWVMYD